MPWSRTWLNGLGTPVNLQMQILAHHMQLFLNRVWEGDTQSFLQRVTQEHEQLRRHLEHRKLGTGTLTRAMKEVSKLAHSYVTEMMKRPTEITYSQFISLYNYTQSVEQMGKLV